MADETPQAPDPVAQLEKAIAERTAQLDAKAPAPAGQAKPAATTDKASEEKKAAVSETTESVPDKAAQETPPAPAPETPAPSGPLWLPVELRPKVPNLAPELLAHFEKQAKDAASYAELRKEFTQKTQIRSDVEEKAQNWQRLMATPGAAEAALAKMKGEAEESATPAEDWDPDDGTHTAKDNLEHYREVARQDAERIAEEVAKRQWRERVEAPNERKSGINDALLAFQTEHSVSNEDMQKVLSLADAKARKIGTAWTPANAAGFAEIGLELLRASNPPAKVVAPGLSKVASPQSRGVGTTAPSVPAWKRAGKTWPDSDAGRADFFRELTGLDVTSTEIANGKA